MLPTYFQLARKASKKSDYKIQVGACIVRNGTPIAVGYNKIRYDSRWGNRWNYTLHAECHALKSISSQNTKGSTLYIYREKGKDKRIGLAKPCQDCMSKIRAMGIKKIVYSIEEYPYYREEYL